MAQPDPRTIEHAYLGRSGLKVSRLIYGNWLTHASEVDEQTAISSVHAALDAGITSFDTADTYANTEAEKVLGRALKGQRRESLEILSKVYYPTGPKGPNDTGLSRKHILESIDGSLTRLGTDHLDVYQAHRFDVETPLEETIQAFADVVAAGKAIYIGVSEWTADQLARGQELARQAGFRIISNQPQYSLLWRVIEAKVVPASLDLGVSQIVWSPLAGGVLTGKYRPGRPLPEHSRATDEAGGGARFVGEWLRDGVLSAVDGPLRRIADDLGVTLAQLSLAWVLHQPGIASAIIGASRPEQITSNVQALDVRLDDDALTAIDAATRPVAAFDPALTRTPAHRLA